MGTGHYLIAGYYSARIDREQRLRDALAVLDGNGSLGGIEKGRPLLSVVSVGSNDVYDAETEQPSRSISGFASEIPGQ
jgi:hypothetical protein